MNTSSMKIQRRRVMTAGLWALLVPATGVLGVTLSTPDTFTSTLSAWRVGNSFNPNQPVLVPTGGADGASDGYMMIAADSFGTGGKLVVFIADVNPTWTGNYVAAGAGSVSVRLNNFNAGELKIRVGFMSLQGSASNGWVSKPVTVPGNSGWISAKYPITESNMVKVGFAQTPLSAFMQNVQEVRILHSVNDQLRGDTITATLGIDNPQLLPAPCTRADITDGSGTGTADGKLTGSDVVAFFQDFFAGCAPGTTPCTRADLTDGSGSGAPDGLLTGSDVVAFFQDFFAGCGR